MGWGWGFFEDSLLVWFWRVVSSFWDGFVGRLRGFGFVVFFVF